MPGTYVTQIILKSYKYDSLLRNNQVKTNSNDVKWIGPYDPREIPDRSLRTLHACVTPRIANGTNGTTPFDRAQRSPCSSPAGCPGPSTKAAGRLPAPRAPPCRITGPGISRPSKSEAKRSEANLLRPSIDDSTRDRRDEWTGSSPGPERRARAARPRSSGRRTADSTPMRRRRDAPASDLGRSPTYRRRNLHTTPARRPCLVQPQRPNATVDRARPLRPNAHDRDSRPHTIVTADRARPLRPTATADRGRAHRESNGARECAPHPAESRHTIPLVLTSPSPGRRCPRRCCCASPSSWGS